MPAEALPQRLTAAPIPDAASLPVARLVEWKPWTHSAGSRLAGHCAVAFSGGWNVAKIPIFRDGNGGLSAGVPSVPELDGDGRVRTRADGARTYAPVISFANATAKARWQGAVLAALAAAGVVP